MSPLGFAIRIVTTSALLALACSCASDEKSAAPQPNPGRVFDGTYDFTWKTSGGQPVADTGPVSKWTVSTHCPADTGPCYTAMAVKAVNDAAQQQKMVFDYADGTWTGVSETPGATCKTKSGADLGQAPTWSRVVVSPAPNSTDGTSLLVSNLQYIGNPCGQRTEATGILVRTGDVDPAADLAKASEIAPGKTSPGQELRGKYNVTFTQAEVPGQSTTPPSTTAGTFETLCLRDASRCASVWSTSDRPVNTFYTFSDGRWTADYTAAEESCDNKNPDSPRRATRTVHDELTRTDTTAGPVQTLAGVRIATFSGDCPRTGQWTIQVTRTGD